MADLAAVFEGLAANFSSIPDCQKSAWFIDNPTPPTIMIAGLDTRIPTGFGRDSMEWRVSVKAFVANATDIGQQQQIARFLAASGDYSISAAIESDPLLTSRRQTDGSVLTNQDPACEDLAIVEVRGAVFTHPETGLKLLGAEFVVLVETSES